VYEMAAVPGDGALHADEGGALESESTHDVRPLAAAVGVSVFDVSKAANVQGRVSLDVCRSGSGMRELAQGLGPTVETMREAPPGLCLRGDVMSESPHALCEAAQALYPAVPGPPRGRRGHEGAGTGRRRES
jgi:hypothetical protein